MSELQSVSRELEVAERTIPVRRSLISSVAVHLLLMGGYSVLAVVLTWPVALDMLTKVPGGGDAWQHIWNLWWVKEALLQLHTNPYHTNLIYYPDGVNLYFHTLVLTAGLIGIPLQLLGFNLIATYNLILLSSFVLAGYGAFLLCLHFTRNLWASCVGGLVFAFSPYHFAHLYGHMNLSSLQWIPFYALLLFKALDSPGGAVDKGSRSRGIWLSVGAGVLLAVNAYTDWLYALFLALLTALVLAWKIIVPAERRSLAQLGVGWAEGAARLSVGAVAALLLVSPILLPTLQEAGQGYAQMPANETLVYSSDLILAFTPSELHPLWGKAISAKVSAIGPYLPMKGPSERVVFLGYVVLALAAYAAWKHRANLQVRFWVFAAAAFWLLSLGPILQVAGKTTFTTFGVTIPLPYLLLYKLPLFSIMRTPARLTVLTMLALAVLVAFGLRYMSLKWPTRAYRAAAVVLPTLILFEFLSLPYPTVPPGWGVPIYSKIAAEPGQFALLELPIRPMGDYMAYQTVHGKPIIGGYLSRQPPYPALYNVPALKYLLDATDPSDPVKDQITDGKGVKSLSDLGVKYIIVRWWPFRPEQKVAMQTKLDVLLDRPPDFSYPADLVGVWQLKP